MIIFDFGVGMLDYIHKALSLKYTSSDGSYLSCLLEELNHLDVEQRIGFLKVLGSYLASYPYPVNDLDQLYKLFGPIPDTGISFAESIFDIDVEKYDCASIGEKLEHRFFSEVRSELKSLIYTRLITHTAIPSFFEPHEVETLIPGNFEAYPIIKKSAFITLLKSRIQTAQTTKSFIGGSLAIEIRNQFKTLQSHYPSPLLPLQVEENNVEIVKALTSSYLTESIRNMDLKAFLSHWGEGGLLFVSCLLFAREHEKESNRDFWREYFHWLKIDSIPDRKYSQSRFTQRIYPILKSFWDNENIAYVVSKNNSIQYVLTFRMHSIVANRPLSKRLITRFLVKVIKSNGVIFHDAEDQENLLYDTLSEYSRPLIEEEVDDSPINTSLQLPRETAEAFNTSSKQVLLFLAPVYDYMERRLVDTTNNNLTSYSKDIFIPQYLSSYVEKSIQETTIEEIKRIRSVLGNQLRGPVSLVLDTKQKCLNCSVPVYSFIDLPPNSDITFSLIDSGEIVFQKESLEYDTVGSSIFTRQFTILCDKFSNQLLFQFNNEEKILAKGNVVSGPIFNTEGEPIRFPCKTDQPVLCIAKEGTIYADYLDNIHPNVLGNYSIWETYLSENSPILIDDILYGVGSDYSKKRSGVIYSRNIYQEVHFSCNKTDYPVIGEYPTIFFRSSANSPIQDAITFILDGREIPFIVVSNTLLNDGSGESFYRLRIHPAVEFPNGKLVVFRLFSLVEHVDYLTETWFCLKNLNIQYSKPLYFGDKDIEISDLSFENRDALFQNHNYSFPNTLTKYKLELGNEKDNRLILHPPMISVTSGGQSLFDRNFWYDDLVNLGGILVNTPNQVANISLFTTDSINKVTHRLKKHGDTYNTEYLSQLPETTDSFIMLYLLGYTTNGKFTQPICKIYYRVAKKENNEEAFFYIPPSNDVRFNDIQPGLQINLSYYCSKNKTYSLNIGLRDSHSIISGKLNPDGTFSYYQKDNLEKGIYRITVYETTVNVFSGKATEKRVYSSDVNYDSGITKESINTVIDNLVPTTYVPKMQLRTIQLITTVKRVFKKDGFSYMPHIPLRFIFIEADCMLSDNQQFSTRIFFYDRNDRIINIDRGELFSVTVIKLLKNGRIILQIKDKNNRPLRVGEYSGYVNSLNSSRSEHIYECIYFLGKIVQ